MLKLFLISMLFPYLVFASLYYQFEDGVTMTQETIGDVTYFRTSDGDEFTAVRVGNTYKAQDKQYDKYLNSHTPRTEVDRPEGLRYWRDKSGNQLEAKFISKSGNMVTLELVDGHRKTFPLDGFSDLDKMYVGENALPEIRLDVGKVQYNAGSYYDSVRFRVKAKYDSTFDFPLGINIHFFVFSESDELIRHEHRDSISFEGREKKFEFETSSFTFLDSTAHNADQSRKYGGYLVVVTDSRHRVINTRYTNEKAKKKLDKLIEYGIKKMQIDNRLPFRELSPHRPSSQL